MLCNKKPCLSTVSGPCITRIDLVSKYSSHLLSLYIIKHLNTEKWYPSESSSELLRRYILVTVQIDETTGIYSTLLLPARLVNSILRIILQWWNVLNHIKDGQDINLGIQYEIPHYTKLKIFLQVPHLVKLHHPKFYFFLKASWAASGIVLLTARMKLTSKKWRWKSDRRTCLILSTWRSVNAIDFQ